MEIKNAKIIDTELGKHSGCYVAYITLDYGGAQQAFGGNILDEVVQTLEGKFIKREGTAFGMGFLMRIMETLEVFTWEKLKGTPCRVKSEHNKIHPIGHYLKDQWFTPEELRKEFGFE